jgi:hypothetical protein
MVVSRPCVQILAGLLPTSCETLGYLLNSNCGPSISTTVLWTCTTLYGMHKD